MTRRNKNKFKTAHTRAYSPSNSCMPGLRASIVGWIRKNSVTNTAATYATYQKQYVTYAQSKNLNPRAAESVCDFLKHGLENRKLGRSTLTRVIPAAIADLYKFDEAPLQWDALVQGTKSVIKRNTKPSKPRKPMTRAHLKKMARECENTVKEVRDVLLFIMMFLGLLRESEAVALEDKDVWVDEVEGYDRQMMYIVIRKSKTDQTGETATVVLSACPESDICPVRWLQHYRSLRGKATCLFAKTDVGGPLAKRTVRALVKAWLLRIGVNPEGYGSHSMRRGGATAAVAANVKMHVLKRHGRWASDAVYLYVVDAMAEKLSLSRSILEQ